MAAACPACGSTDIEPAHDADLGDHGWPRCRNCSEAIEPPEAAAERLAMEAEYRAGTLAPEEEPEEHWTERLADERRAAADDLRKAAKEGA